MGKPKRKMDPMAGVRIECATCGRMHRISEREHHGPTSPRCLYKKYQNALPDYCGAGAFTSLLEEAGLVKRLPGIWKHWKYVHCETKVECSSRDNGAIMVAQEDVYFYAVAPKWAYDLAHKLSRDKSLGRALGYVQKRKLVTAHEPIPGTKNPLNPKRPAYKVTKTWTMVDEDKLLPMKVRVEIMKVAARSELARELIMDDPEAAGRLIRDCS